LKADCPDTTTSQPMVPEMIMAADISTVPTRTVFDAILVLPQQFLSRYPQGK
jgi:hypothetical protein